MVESSTSDTSSTSDNTTSGDGGIVDFLMSPIGMAVAGGFVIALVAGYMIL